MRSCSGSNLTRASKRSAYDHLLNLPGCREMDFTGKPMKGFLFIYPEGFDNEADLDFWVERALEFNRDGAVAKKKGSSGFGGQAL